MLCSQAKTRQDAYGRVFATTALDRQKRVSRRRRNFVENSSSITQEHQNLFDNVPLSSLNTMDAHMNMPLNPNVPPSAAEWTIIQQQYEAQRLELENLKQQNRPKSIGTIFNSTITSLPSCLVLPPIPIGVTFQKIGRAHV